MKIKLLTTQSQIQLFGAGFWFITTLLTTKFMATTSQETRLGKFVHIVTQQMMLLKIIVFAEDMVSLLGI